MSAKTRQDLQQIVGALTLLFTNVVELIRGGKRSASQIHALRQALQLFKENRLATVLAAIQNPDAEHIRPFCSIEVSTLKLSHTTLRWLREAQIVYVGELLHRRDWTKSRDDLKAHREIRELLVEWGLPLKEVNMNDVGWIPPYMGDPDVLAGLNLWVHELPNSPRKRVYMRDGCSDCLSLGEIIRTGGRRLRWVFGYSNGINVPHLRVNMFIPDSWTPNGEHPHLDPTPR